MTLRSYLELVRLTAGMRLLCNPDVLIVLIGTEVGYGSYRSFARAFKRRIGCTAEQCRKRLSAFAASS
ncbi:MAG: helix-turn-helix domain-containing protein [Bacteroidetes bacterium]|nr:helix-turn-helix domain-containing protein [Bacteroidota bacterium]